MQHMRGSHKNHWASQRNAGQTKGLDSSTSLSMGLASSTSSSMGLASSMSSSMKLQRGPEGETTSILNAPCQGSAWSASTRKESSRQNDHDNVMNGTVIKCQLYTKPKD